MNRRAFSVIMMLFGVLIASVSAAGNCPERVGHWPYGPSTVIAHTGHHMVYGSGTVLVVADVTDPAAPEVVGELRLGGLVSDLDVSGSLAVVASVDQGLLAVDLTDPSHPSLAGTLGDIGEAYRVALNGTTAWVATRSGLVAVDVSDRSHPAVVSTVTPGGTRALFDVAVSGDLAMVSDTFGDLVYTVDISDPASPRELGSVEIGWGVGTVIAGDYAYVADKITGVQVVDISDPANPTIVTTVKEGSGYYEDVEVSGNLLLLAHQYYGLVTFDISDPSAPAVLGRLNTAGEVESTAYTGGTVFIADGCKGVVVADLSDAADPKEIASLPGHGELMRIGAAGDLAAVLETGDMKLFDISTPATPTPLAGYDPNEWAVDVELSGNVAYLVLKDKALETVDVSDPAHPEKLGSLDLEKGDVLAVRGGRAVVAGDGLLTVADVSDPEHPTELGRLALDYDRAPSGVFLAANAAYVSERGAGLHVIDLSDPAHPSESGVVEVRGASHIGAVRGDVLVIGDQGNGLRLFDISDPLHPRELSTFTDVTYFSAVDVTGDLLGVASIYNGMFLLDISDPTNPALLGTAPMVHVSEADAAFAGDLFLVTEREAGMEIFNVSACAVEPPEASFTWTPAIPEAGETVHFTDTSSGGVTSWAWDFGNGTSSTKRNPRRSFGRPGSYPVTLTVTGPKGSDSITRVVTVSGGASATPPITEDAPWRAVIPAGAHTGGLHGTSWVSDVVLHNPGADDATAHLYFMERDHDNSGAAGWEIKVGAGASVALGDVVGELFGESRSSGAILVASDRELVVTSRTYNDAASGTYGQFIPGLSVDTALTRARLIQLRRGSDFRTNIGLANPTAVRETVTIRLFDAGGAQVGSDVSVTLHPFGFHQVTDIFPADVADGSAEVWTDTAGGAFFAYASVVDNVTGDPVFVVPAPEAGDLWIPAAAHVSGYQGTRWRTDVELANGSASSAATFTVELLESGRDNSHPKSATVQVDAGATRRLDDLLDGLFHFSGSAALHVTADRSDATISSRTYNQTSNGTYGQYIPGVTGEDAVTPSHPARLVQLEQSSSNATGFRTNIGLVNTTASSVDVTIALHGWDGGELGTVPVTLKPYEFRQIDRIFRSVTSSPVTNGYAVVTTSTSGGKVLVYASVIDNASGDPICILPE